MQHISFIDIIYFIANTCALLAAYMLFFKFYTYRKLANRLLGGFLILNAYCNFTYLLIITGWIQEVPYLYKVAAPITYLIAPLALLYVRSVLYNETRLRKTDILHLIPFIIFFINYLPFYVLPLVEKQEIVNAVVNNVALNYTHKDGLLPEGINILCRSIQSIVYLILQWRIIVVFYKGHKEVRSIPQLFALKKWVITFTSLITFYYLSLTLLYILVANNIINSTSIVPKHPYTLGITITSYLIAVVYFSIGGYILINAHQLFGIPQLSISNPFKQKDKKKGAFSVKNVENNIEILENYFRSEHPFLNKNLNINIVSVATGISSRDISFIINNQFHQRFTDYVNCYRINYVLNEIDIGDLKSYTWETIAMKAGFGSRSAFNAAFKKVSKVTPSEYLKKIKNI